METKEKIALLEEIMELDEGTLTPEMTLKSIKKWNSLAALTFIIALDENFNKIITVGEIKKFKTIEDMLNVMA